MFDQADLIIHKLALVKLGVLLCHTWVIESWKYFVCDGMNVHILMISFPIPL